MPARARGRASTALVLATGALLGLAGCSDDGPDAALVQGPPPTTAAAPGTTVATPPTTPAPAPVLAGVEGDLPGIRLELNTLERENDEVVRLGFTLINTGVQPFTFGDNFGDPGTVSGVAIVDTANEQNLGALTDEGGACRCSRNLAVLAPGERLPLFAELSAPPGDIGVVSVIVPHFPGVQRISMS